MRKRTANRPAQAFTAPIPPSTSGSSRNSLSQVGPDCSADNHGDSLEESSGWSPRQTDGGLTERAKKTTGSSSCSKRPRDYREPKNKRRKARLTREAIVWVNRKGEATKTTHKEVEAKIEPCAINRVGKDANQRRNRKATQRDRYKRTITEIVRKALKRLRRKPQESNHLGTRSPGGSPSCGKAGNIGPSKRARPDTRKSTNRSKSSQYEEREIEKLKELRQHGLLSKMKKIKQTKGSKEAIKKEKAKIRETLIQARKKLGNAKHMKQIQSIIRAMVFNVEGINKLNKRQELEEYAYNQAISLALCTETQHPHSSEEGGIEKINPEGEKARGNYKWYFSKLSCLV